MIVTINKAILHILDANSGITVFSDEELDVTNEVIQAFIIKHIEKTFDDPGLRKGEFQPNSGFLYALTEYKNETTSFQELSLSAAHRIYDGISQAEKTESCDLLVVDCILNELSYIAILKCDNKVGFTHQVIQDSGQIKNELIHHYAILPTITQKISECAYINQEEQTILYAGKKRSIDGESVDLIADILLECIYDISPKESIQAVNKIAKEVTKENGADELETMTRMKKFVVESIEDSEEEYEFIDTEAIAEKIFDGSPVMKEEFTEKLKEASVPQKFAVNPYVTKKMSSNIKIVTDTGIEISFPAEYYRNSEYIEIINNEDGTLSIQLNNIGEIINK